jgi:hypothetical protein
MSMALPETPVKKRNKFPKAATHLSLHAMLSNRVFAIAAAAAGLSACSLQQL